MRLTVHRVEVALYHGDRLQHVWHEHKFVPSERVIIDHPNCVNVVWSTSKPVEVEAPRCAGSKRTSSCRGTSKDRPSSRRRGIG